ncbi:MAG TPA: hypothetical protein VFS81_03225, partial [Candidatus Binatia bacterium]|nr:hypothetical protein [Candidatus Binatia bacterium]
QVLTAGERQHAQQENTERPSVAAHHRHFGNFLSWLFMCGGNARAETIIAKSPRRQSNLVLSKDYFATLVMTPALLILKSGSF